MRALYPCAACKRHVRNHEVRCPFCGTACSPPLEPVGAVPRGRPGGRAALFLAAVAGSTGCAREDDDDDMVQPVYGVPIDAGVDADTDAGPEGGPASPDAGIDATAQPVYGIAIDASLEDADAADADAADAEAEPDARTKPPPSKDAAVQPVYGIPVDASVKDAELPDADYEDVMGIPVYGVVLDTSGEEPGTGTG